MNNLNNLLKKEALVHQKIFLIILECLILIVMLATLFNNFISKGNIIETVNYLNTVMPLIILIVIKTEEERYLGLSSLLVTKYSRQTTVITRYLFVLINVLIFCGLSFATTLILKIIPFKANFGLLISRVSFILSLISVLNCLSFILNYKKFAVWGAVVWAITRVILQPFDNKFEMINIVQLFLNLIIAIFFFPLSVHLFNKKDV